MAAADNPFGKAAPDPGPTDPAASPNPFGGDMASPDANAPTLNSVVQNFEAAGNTDLAKIAGLPGDAIQGAGNLIKAGVDKVVPQSWRDWGNSVVPSWAQGITAPTSPVPSS